MASKTYNLFISHSWTYSDAYVGLRKLLDKHPTFTYRDYSVPKDDPIHNAANAAQLTAAIQRQMRSCHVVIILSGVYSTYSKWITKEIELAASGFTDPKPILGIKPWAAERESKVVQEAATLMVNWNTQSIVNGIRDISI
jgi:hypothetical protein